MGYSAALWPELNLVVKQQEAGDFICKKWAEGGPPASTPRAMQKQAKDDEWDN